MTDISKLADILVAAGKLARESAQTLVKTILKLTGENPEIDADTSVKDVLIPLDDPLPYDEQPEPGPENDPFERFNRTFFDEPIERQKTVVSKRKEKTARIDDRIAELRRIAYRRENRNRSPEEIFCLQAEYAKDIEDDYAFSQAVHFDSSNKELGRYFSGFAGMSVHSLRSYFTWRTRLRHGEMQYGSLVFAFIYATELINLIGVNSPEEGYNSLRGFMTEYAKFDHRIVPFTERWLQAMVICYGLPAELLPPEKSAGIENKLSMIEHPDEADDESLFEALDSASSYKLFSSRMYKLFVSDFRTVITRVFRRLHSSMDREEFTARFVGKRSRMSYDLFSPALFFENNKDDREYKASEYCSYIRRNGKWYSQKLTRSSEQSAALGAFLKNTDYLMRKHFKLKSTLKVEPCDDDENKLISETIVRYLKEKEEAERLKIEIDFSKLSTIRSSSLETQNMLLIDEADAGKAEAETITEQEMSAQELEEKRPCPLLQTAESPIGALEKPSSEAGRINLTSAEKLLLSLLIDGKPYEKEMLATGVLPSIAADSINEKLFELLSDTAIIDSGNGLEPVEDYIDELKGILSAE